MEAVLIKPEDIGTYEWAETWKALCKKFGYPDNENVPCIVVVEIKGVY